MQPVGYEVGLYVPAATQIWWPLEAALMAACKFWKAQAHEVPVPPLAAAASTYQIVPLAGQFGWTARVNVQVPVSPTPSVAVSVTVWLPMGMLAPTMGDCAFVGLAVQLSEAVAEAVKSVIV